MFRWNRTRWFWAGAMGLGLVPILAIFALVIFLFWNAAGASIQIGLTELAAAEWSPRQGRYGVALLLAGTLAVTVLALCLAVWQFLDLRLSGACLDGSADDNSFIWRSASPGSGRPA
jgi:hypothetical protein